MWPALIKAGASLLGGLMNRESAQEANAQIARNNQLQIEQAEKNRQMQLDFAQQGVRWKVDDARAAGIHPLYALGANTVSYSPVSVGQASPVVDTSMGSALASAGQDISRSINSTRTAGERSTAFDETVRGLTLQKMGLENELLSSQIAKLRASSNPPMPGPSPVDPVIAGGPVPDAKKWEEAPKLMFGGEQWTPDSKTASMKAVQDRWGDEGPPQWLVAPYVMWRDYLNTVASNDERARMNPFHRDPRSPVRKWWVDRMLEWR